MCHAMHAHTAALHYRPMQLLNGAEGSRYPSVILQWDLMQNLGCIALRGLPMGNVASICS